MLTWLVVGAVVYLVLDQMSRRWKPRVSRNPPPTGDGPKWEQDEVFAECFDDNDAALLLMEDDL